MDRWRIKAAMGLVCILTVSAFALTGCAQTEKSDVITIRIAHDNNVNTPLHKAFLKFKDLVETGSEGRMEVVIFPGGQMGSVQDTFEQCRRGDIEMSGSTTSNFTRAMPEFAAWESFYMFDDTAHAKRVFESEAGKKMMEPLKRMNLTGIGYMELGFRNFSNSKRPIQTEEDLKGLKIRGYNPLQIKAWESVGVNTTSVSWNELFTSLQQRLIDGQECATTSFYTEKFYEAQKYWSPCRIPTAPLSWSALRRPLIITGNWRTRARRRYLSSLRTQAFLSMMWISLSGDSWARKSTRPLRAILSPTAERIRITC